MNDRRSGEIKFLPPVKPRYKVTESDGKKYILDTNTGIPVSREQVQELSKAKAVKGWVGPAAPGQSGPYDVATYLNMKAESKGK